VDVAVGREGADEGNEALAESVVVALELALILPLVCADEVLVLAQRIAAPFAEVLEAEAQLVLQLRRPRLSVRQVREEHERHLHRTLIHRRADATLKHHLQHLGVRRLLVRRLRQLLRLFLHVLDRHLDWRQHHLSDFYNFQVLVADLCLDGGRHAKRYPTCYTFVEGIS
jgi:hypothetical protein